MNYEEPTSTSTKVDPVKWGLRFTFRLEPVWVPARVMGGGNGLLENKIMRFEGGYVDVGLGRWAW